MVLRDSQSIMTITIHYDLSTLYLPSPMAGFQSKGGSSSRRRGDLDAEIMSAKPGRI
jgi:hypothetical protein